MVSSSPLSVLALLAVFAQVTYTQDDNPCKSFGIDFQDQGTYFQNSLSTSNFTFVSEFTGCQSDIANNIFVDPYANQVQCTDTQMQPNDTPQLSTCPDTKNDLVSGDYSVIIISNNGDAQPIAYQRDFILSVGPQVTNTYTPTVVVPTTITPVVNNTMIVTDTTSTTLPVQTVTVPSTTIAPIRTVTPSRVTSTVIKTLWTIHRTVPTVVIQKQIKYVTASCSVPPRQSTPDITCQITPTILRAKALQTPVANKRALPGRLAMRQVDPEDLNDIPKFLADRRARLAAAGKNALVKRAPDLATMTVTDTKTADYITQTSTATAPTLTNIITNTKMVTATVTPPPITLMNGQTTLQVTTITAPTPTRILTKYTMEFDITTRAYTYTVTITSKVTPSASITACKQIGGTWGR